MVGGAQEQLPRVIALGGASATGKSALAQALAEEIGASILSADSMLVYKGMDIGTAKPTPAERGSVPYAGIDLVTPAEPYSAGLWIDAARAAMAAHPDRTWIVVGGTGLYFKAFFEGFDRGVANLPLREELTRVFSDKGLGELHARLRAIVPDGVERLGEGAANYRRVIRALEVLSQGGNPFAVHSAEKPKVVILCRGREDSRARMERRVDEMLAAGLVDEVRGLMAQYPQWSETAAAAIGYAEVRDFISGKCTLEAAKAEIIRRTWHLVKRQETWFRHQVDAIGLSANPDSSVASMLKDMKRLLALD